MPKHIHLRNIPDTTHQALKARAAAEGMSMSYYLRRLIEQDLKRPDWASIRARLTSMEPVELPVSTTRIIREVRGVNRVVYDVTSKPPGTIEWE